MTNARTVSRSCGPKSFNISLQTSIATVVHLACAHHLGGGSVWWVNALSQTPTLSSSE